MEDLHSIGTYAVLWVLVSFVSMEKHRPSDNDESRYGTAVAPIYGTAGNLLSVLAMPIQAQVFIKSYAYPTLQFHAQLLQAEHTHAFMRYLSACI